MEIQSQVHAEPGQLRGPTTESRQVSQVTIHVERLPGGRMRVTTPTARGWAMVVSNPIQMAAVVTEALNEAQIAAYALWRAERYDLDELTEPQEGDPMAPPRARARRQRNSSPVGWGMQQVRPDIHSPEDWMKTADGRWQSPNGATYRADTATARRVISRRQQFGLPT